MTMQWCSTCQNAVAEVHNNILYTSKTATIRQVYCYLLLVNRWPTENKAELQQALVLLKAYTVHGRRVCYLTATKIYLTWVEL